MARLVPGVDVRLEGLLDPTQNSDAATKEYVDENSGSDLTPGEGIDITNGVVSVADEGITEVKLNVTNTPTTGQLLSSATDATAFTWVTPSGGTQYTADDVTLELDAGNVFAVKADGISEPELNAANTPTAGQVLSSTSGGDGFTWVDQSAGGSSTDYNNASFGNFDRDGTTSWTFNATGNPSSVGEVSFADDGVAGHTLTFRTEDVDVINSVSVNFFQIGFGSPIVFATYAVADLNVADDFVQVSLINGPLDGDDILATFPADNTALSIIVSVSQFRLPVSGLADVSETAATDNQVLTWNDTNSEWAPATAQSGITSIVNGGHIDVSTADGVSTLTFNEVYDLWNGKNDWVQINTGTPSGDNILWDATTETLSVPSLGGREILEILLDARSGMAVHIRQENTTSTPSGFQSGFYQIREITATDTPSDLVTLQLLPDGSDIFTETEGNTYQYELSILQFVTGGTLDNLTLNRLADVDVSTLPTDGQVLAFDTSTGTYVPADNAGGGGGGAPQLDYNNANLGALSDPAVSYTYTTETSPVNEGEVSIAAVDSPSTGFDLLFRRADVDVKSLQSVRLLQIGFGSPITFATYAVSTTSFINSVDPLLVSITLVDVPLDGDDLLAALPADDTALSITVSSNEFENPDLGDLPDVDFSTAPTDGQVLAYELATDTWKPADDSGGSTPDLGDLGDVNTNGVADGFLIRYDGPNSNYRAHSVSNTVAVYGGLSSNRDGTLVTPVSSGLNSLAVGNDTEATGEDSIAVGVQAEATHESAIAIGAGATAFAASSLALGELTSTTHANSTAIGEGAGTDNNNELRLGSTGTHVTVPTSVAGNESEDNQLVSKKWVNNQISDSSRVISSTANALENLTTVTDSTPWDDYRIVPGTALEKNMQVHMYEFDATESQFIFYPGFMSNAFIGNGTDLTVNDTPSFFEEVTNIGNEAEVTDAAGDAVTSLGWKYLGHDTAIVWQAVSHVYTFNFEWIYPNTNSDGTQNPPDVTSSLELVRLKPTGVNTYNMATNATVIASSPTSFHNAGSLEPGESESFTGSYEFSQQLLADGISNVENGDVFAYRMKVRYKGNGFDGDTNVRLAITESEVNNITPQIGIRHVGRDYSLVLEDSGDLQWTDHGSAIETNLLLIDNTGDGPEIPAATLGLVGGEGISVTGKTINVNLQNLNSGLEFDDVNDLRVDVGDGIQLDTNGVSLDFRTETNNPLEVSGTGDAAGLALNIDEDGPLSKTANGLDVIVETNGGLAVGSLNSGLEILLPSDSGLQTLATGLSLNADLDELNDVSTTAPTDGQVLTWNNTDTTWEPADSSSVGAFTDLSDVTIASPTDGQIVSYNGTTNLWQNTSLSGNHSFTAGDGLSFNSDGTVLDITANVFDFSRLSFDTGDVVHSVNSGATRFIAIGANGVIGGASSVNIGVASQAIATNTIAIGAATRAEGTVATAVGGGARAMAVDSSAYGREAVATGIRSTALGDSAQASATDSTSVGTESNATGTRSTAMGRNTTASGTDSLALGNNSSTSGTNSVSVGAGATGSGDRAVAIGSAPDTGAAALGIAIGERAVVSATRGIAIGSSSNSASDSADRVQATGSNAIAIGRAASAVAAQGVAIGDDTRALAADATAFGPSAQVTSTGIGSTAIGHNATATIANSTVLGSGTGHRVFAGSREVAIADNRSGDITNIECSINNEFFSDGFNPSTTNSEILRYTQINDLAIGRFDYKIALSTSTNFLDGDRWAISSTSGPMRDAFGYTVGTYGIAIGTFVVAGSAANSAAIGDMWLRPGSTTTNISILFRVRDVIGTAPTRDSYISAQFNIAKF